MKYTLVLVLFLLCLAPLNADEPSKDALVEAITSFHWNWINKVATPGKKSIEDLDFNQDGAAENAQYWTARWEVTGPRTLVLTLDDTRAYIVFNADYTRYVGFDFNGETTVSGKRLEHR